MTATNAPYYQMRGQFSMTPNGANVALSQPQQQHFVSEDDVEYDLSTASPVVTAHEQSSLYTSDRQTDTDTPINTLEDNHNLVELLEAATTAAGQAAQAMNSQADNIATVGGGKRKRGSSPALLEDDATGEGNASLESKRARVNVDPQLQGAENGRRGRLESSSAPPGNNSLLNDPRNAGVHSAAALFRRSSEKTPRKYTRPPMSMLFLSLQLSPENFLRLQARAKSFMLDPAHPERQNCVGNRGKGDTDMVKLRLFNCVRDFLNGGTGELFFGEHVEKPGEDDAIGAAHALGEEQAPVAENRLHWPRDGNKIISLVTPLLRRMVTNERQRMYAIETRKGGGMKKKESDAGAVEADQHGIGDSFIDKGSGEQVLEQQLQNAFDSANENMGQVQSTHLISPSSPPRDPANSGQVGYPPFQASQYNSDQDIQRREKDIEQVPQLELPTQGPAEPCLERINIFLTTKKHVKLEEKRISVQHPTHLMNFPWPSLQNEIQMLLKSVMAKYPKIRENTKASKPQSMAPEALRGLAVAADALESVSVTNEFERLSPGGISGLSPSKKAGGENVPSAPSAPSSSNNNGNDNTRSGTNGKSNGRASLTSLRAVFAADGLPEYKLRTCGTNGWKTITVPQEWHYALLDHAFAAWADGVCTLMVELLDV